MREDDIDGTGGPTSEIAKRAGFVLGDVLYSLAPIATADGPDRRLLVTEIGAPAHLLRLRSAVRQQCPELTDAT